ncbi:MAG: SRPBCC domain-containing protein [Burkholderiales bacterium]
MSDSIHQEITVDANADRIYEALTNARHFSGFTGGAPSEIDGTAGGAFSGFGGMITGRNVELVPGRRVVQAWRAKNWPDGTYSIIRFELEARGKATHVVFDQSGFPATAKQDLEAGWHKMYWDPLRKYLG